MKRNKKILLAGGDSLTEHTLVSCFAPHLSTDFPRWPEVLAEKLDMECVNLGRAGCTNQLISTSIYEYLMENPKKEIGLVCCLWTEYTRTSIYNMPEWPSAIGQSLHSGFNQALAKSIQVSIDEFKERGYTPWTEKHKLFYDYQEDAKESLMIKGPDKFLDLLCYYVKSSHTEIKTIVENIIKNNIKIFHDLECMLSLRNIPYLYLQGVYPFLGRDIVRKDRGLEKIYAPSDAQLLFYLLKYEKYFNKEKFIGWPRLYAGGHRIFFG